MSRVEAVYMIFAIAICAIAAFAVYSIVRETRACDLAGGVLVRGYCISKEVIIRSWNLE